MSERKCGAPLDKKSVEGRNPKVDHGGLNAYLKELYESDVTEESRRSIDLLMKCAHVGEQVFNRLPDSRSSVVQSKAGNRPSEEHREDTYPDHGARVAKEVVKLGILDPLTFCTAYFHDLGGKDVIKGSAHQIRSHFKSMVKKGEIDTFTVEAIIEAIKAFDVEDERSAHVAKTIIQNESADLNFGAEFEPDQFHTLQRKVLNYYTNRVEVIERVGKDGIRVIEEPDDPDKFPSMYRVLTDMADPKLTPMARKVKLAVHTAYLAAVIDNINHPKKGRTPQEKQADHQQIAIGLDMAHLPIYWAMGDNIAHAAEEVIYRAYFPQAYANMEAAWNLVDHEFLQSNRRIYEEFIESQLLSRIEGACKEKNIAIERVDEVEMQRREALFRNTKMQSVDIARMMLLTPNEVYAPAHVDVKTLPSIFRKSLKYYTKHILHLGSQGERLYRDDIVESGFGTVDYWKESIMRSYDILRNRIVLGDAVHQQAQGILEEMDEFAIKDSDTDTIERVPQNKLKSAWGTNSARIPYKVADQDARKKELVEILKIDPLDQRTWNRHYVLGIPVEGVEYNIELHIGGWLAHYMGYVGQTVGAHVNYKLTRQISEMLSNKDLSKENQVALRVRIAELINTLKDEFMTQTPLIANI